MICSPDISNLYFPLNWIKLIWTKVHISVLVGTRVNYIFQSKYNLQWGDSMEEEKRIEVIWETDMTKKDAHATGCKV